MAGRYPLTHPQSRIWHVEQSHPGTSMWNNAGTLKIRGRLDFDLLDKAIQLFLEANESLRLRICLVDGQPMQYVAAHRPVHIDRLDFSSTGVKGLYEWDVRQTQAPMSLIDSPLYYFALAKTAPDEGYLYAKMHHIISDGVSFVVFANEVMDWYDMLLRGETPVPRPAISYLDYVEEERLYRESKRFAYDEAYWLKRFSDFSDATLLKPRTSDCFATKAKRKACVLSAELSAAVRGFCKEHRVSVFALLLSAFSVYLNRVLGKEDLVISAPVSNRTFAGSSERFGMYVSTVPVRVAVDNERAFLDFAEGVSNEWFSVLKHQRYPYDVLMEKIRERRPDIDQLYDISLSYQVGTFETKKRCFSYEGRWHFSGHQASSLNIHWNDRENNGRFVLDYDYLSPLFAAKEVDFIHEHLCNIVADAVAHPEKRLFELAMVSAEERDKVLYRFNDTDDGFERTDLVSLWKRRVAEGPCEPALTYRGRSWTAADLDRASDEVGNVLANAGVAPGDVVALALPRSDVYYAAMLGALKAGAAFMPIDPSLPEERVRYMLNESGTRFALVGPGDLEDRQKGALLSVPVASLRAEELVRRVSCVRSEAAAGKGRCLEGAASEGICAARRFPDPGQAAYLIYTSGSTGTPKGVVVEHAQIAHFVLSMRAVWGRTPGGRMLCVGPVSFDINIMEAAVGLFSNRTLVVADDRQADYPDDLCALMGKERVDLMMVTPGRMEMILSAQAGAHALRGVREIGLGADVLPPELLRRIQQVTSSCVTNFYGPTEVTIAATCCDVTGRVDVNIGRPMNGVRVYILDPHLNPVPIGVPGELYVGGAGVSRGYVARAELTAERFVPSPFVEGERLYRTGDVGRWYPLGEIQFLGRIDRQVKIRGYRVELGEIQNRLLQLEGIRSAAVVAHDEQDGRKSLCAYVAGDCVPPAARMKAHLSESLPFYMVPSCFVELDELPLTTSEKLDVRRLPKPQREAVGARSFETNTQRKLAELWEGILGMGCVRPDDHFFEIGGDSLSIVRMIAAVADAFDANIDLVDVYRDPTLAACAALIDRAEASYCKPVKPVAARRYYPATSTQQRMVLAASEAPDSVAYNVPALFVFEGMLDEDRLKAALEKLLARHAVLRTSLHVRDGAIVQRVHRSVEVPYESVACADARIAACAKRRVRPFDVSSAPLMRLVSIRTPRRHALLFDFHHAVCDQAGLRIVLDDFAALYQGDALPPLAVDYKDCAVWLEGRLASDALEQHAAYWRERLSGDLPVLALPTERPRTGERKGATCEARIAASALASLHALVRSQKATMATALMTVFGLVLSRTALQDEVVIGMPVENRMQPAMQHTAGAFINTVPVRCAFSDGQTVRACFNAVHRALSEAVSHQDYPFERIVTDAGAARQRGRNPLFDAMLVFGKDHVNLTLEGVSATPRFVDVATAKLDVTLFAYEAADGLTCRLEYDRNLFSAAAARRMLDRFVHTAATLFEAPDEGVARVSVLPLEEYQLVTSGFAGDKVPVRNRPLCAWVEDLADQRPCDEAVVASDGRLTFSELDRQADCIACALAEAGAGPRALVAVMMRRSAALLPALFGVMKAGAAYVPVDPTYPADRKALMLADSGARLVLVDRQTCDACPEVPSAAARVVVEDALLARASLDSAQARNERMRRCSEAKPDDPAYVIYTSGSTGVPKGSLLTRAGVANLRDAMASCIGYRPAWTAVSVTTMSFDIFVADALLPLTYGCRTVLADEEELRQPRLLAGLIERERVDFLQATPSRMQIMVRDQAFVQAASRLSTVVLAGEKPPLPLVRTCKRIMPGARLKNGYGPTEVTVYTSFQDMTDCAYVSIGRPIANTRVYVLDEALRPVPVGTYGEAYIAGAGVSPGYIGRPDLNESRFLPDPFHEGGVMYRSGDVCRYDEHGELFIAGRVDHQVKVRGLRIEPGEIEAALCALDGIAEAVVVAHGAGERKQLVAYYTASEPHEVSRLRSALAAQLPSFLVPARFVYLETLPETANGKVDRGRLPDPDASACATTAEPSRPLSGAPAKRAYSAEERRLLRAIEHVLGVRGVSLTDNVFDLGGDSLAVISIQARLAPHGWTLRTQDFYDADTIGDLLARAHMPGAKSVSEHQQNTGGSASDRRLADRSEAAASVARNAAAACEKPVAACSLDRVLVTGATGFLGAHVVAELLAAGAGEVLCLVRAADDVEAQVRLDHALAAYGMDFAPAVRAVRGDVSKDDRGLAASLGAIDAVFHCAAITDHVGRREEYERVNVEGTRRMLELAAMLEAQFMHVSTMSVAGRGGALFDERSFDVGQDVDFNEYARSKYRAEAVVLDAFAKGAAGRVFRVGNLTGRARDGAFQRDVHRNAFAMRLAAYARLGCYPESLAERFEMTPVDSCARSIVLLATCDSHCIAHVCSDRQIDVKELAALLRRCGHPVEPVSDQAFAQCVSERLNSEFKSLFGIVRDVVERPAVQPTEASVAATCAALQAKGFSWPDPDAAYFAPYFAQIQAAVEASGPVRERS